MAGEEAAIISLIGSAFGMFYVGNLLTQEDKWIAASKIIAFSVGFLLFIISVLVGTAFIASPTHEAIVEWGIAAMAVAGILIVFLISLTWVMRMLQGWVPKGKIGYGNKEAYGSEETE